MNLKPKPNGYKHKCCNVIAIYCGVSDLHKKLIENKEEKNQFDMWMQELHFKHIILASNNFQLFSNVEEVSGSPPPKSFRFIFIHMKKHINKLYF